MTDLTEDGRREFEAEMVARGHFKDALGRYPDGPYQLAAYQRNWEIWQAAWTARAARERELWDKLRDLALKTRSARTTWLESFGVPISHEFADFADVLGELIKAALSETQPEPQEKP